MSTVLVVEPHDDTREMLTEFFRWEGLDVLAAATTDAALTRANRADVIITALHVGGSVDGIGLIQKLHAEHRGRQIIACTTCGLPRFEEAARAAGCDAFLVKPCDLVALLAVVRSLAQRRTALSVLPSA
jgi:CheY-like chemotaxis protein